MTSPMIWMANHVVAERIFGLDAQMFMSVGLQLVNGILLAVILGWLLYRPVKKFMQERTARIEKEIADAASLKADAENLEATYQMRLDEIDAQKEMLIEETRQRVKRYTETKENEAKLHANAILEKAHAQIESDKAQFKAESEAYIIQLATTIAEQYVTDHFDDKAQALYFERALKELEASEWKL